MSLAAKFKLSRSVPARRGNVCRQAVCGSIIVASVITSLTGCHDGPLYALKYANPYFHHEWRQDRAFGVTDHQRRQELLKLSKVIDTMEPKEQAFWYQQVQNIMESDPSPEMRRLCVLAAGKVATPDALTLIETGLKDDNLMVQMQACKALGVRKEPRAAEILATTIGSTSELDVKHAAIEAIAQHDGKTAVNSLRLVLEDVNPATTDLAISSLRTVTNEDYGTDPAAWIAKLDQATPADGDANNPRLANEPQEIPTL